MGLREDLTSLVKPTLSSGVKKRLTDLEAQGALAGQTSTLIPGAPNGGSSGSGIASPITINSITYHPEQTLASTDGLFVLRVQPWQTWNCTDANGTPLVINFPAP